MSYVCVITISQNPRVGEGGGYQLLRPIYRLVDRSLLWRKAKWLEFAHLTDHPESLFSIIPIEEQLQ